MVNRRWSLTVVIACACCVAGASDASAQSDNRLALGGSVTTRIAGSSATGGSASINFEARLGHERKGWDWQLSLLNWFDTDVQGQPTPAMDPGRLRIRPILAGYGRTWLRGRMTVTADVVGGLAINSFHLDPAAAAAYRTLGASGVDAAVSNTFAIKPEVQIWYDMNRRFGIKLDGGYLITRPTVTVSSTVGAKRWDVRADTVLITVGLVYSIM
jgi:hypothetical protein